MIAPADVIPFVLHGPSADEGAAAEKTLALIVDPDAQSRAFLRHLLTDIDLEVVEAESAAAARERLAAHTVHVAVVEVNLAKTPGDVLAGELARAGVTPILMSAGAYGIARARKTRFPLLRKPLAEKDVLREVVLALPPWGP
jgi:DNA-binding NtrC family response regulator